MAEFERQVSFSLRNCTERSLLVIDEFGKGTESQDGAGLFAGLCHTLTRRRRSCPKAILATHFQHIFFMGDLVDSRSLALAHMALVKTGFARDETDYDFAFTFKYAQLVKSGRAPLILPTRLREGLMKDSLACECASKEGISDRITARAAAVTCVFWSGEKVADETSDFTGQEAEKVTRLFLKADFSSPASVRSLLEGLLGEETDMSSSRHD